MLRRRAGAVAGVAVSAAMFVSNAQAATYTVTTANDDAPGGSCDTTTDQCTTLRDAITQANTDGTADTIEFASDLSGDTIELKTNQGEEEGYAYNPLDLYDSGGATIVGPAGGITVSGDGKTQILEVSDAASISGMTFTDGSTGSPGGAIEAFGGSGASLSLVNDTISGNTTTDENGGGIYSDQPLTLTGTTVSGNTSADNGGGIAMNTYDNDDSNLTVTGSTISGNTAARNGGAVWGGHQVSIAGTTIHNNSATDAGGGLFLNPKYGATVTGSTITGNTAGSSGGGVGISAYAEDEERGFGPKYDPVQIESSTISGNQAPVGAGINVEDADSPITISSSTLSGNGTGATTFGGGLAIDGYVYSKFKVIDSTISGNTATTGGGVSLGDASHYRLIFSKEGTTGSIAFDNSTIDANTASHGGGIYLGDYTSGDPTEYSGTASINSTIVANDTPDDLERASGSTSGGFDSAFSLIQNAGGAPYTDDEDILAEDPQLGPLTVQDGGTTATMMPKGTSPVIDQGHASPALTTDQNGNKRTVVNAGITKPPGGDGTDIGSVELQPGQATIPTTPPPPPAQSPGFGVSIYGKNLGPSPLLVFRYVTPVTCTVKHGSLASCAIEVHARNGQLIADGEVIGNSSQLTAKVIRTPAGYALLEKNPLAGVGATMSAIGSPTGLPTVSGAVNFLAGQSLRFHITSNDLTGTLKAQLSELARVIAGAKEVTCTAYTDRPKGDTTVADAQADKSKTVGEAQAVCSYLKRHGLTEARFTSTGKGHKNPIGSNKTEAGRSENQRVRISFTF